MRRLLLSLLLVLMVGSDCFRQIRPQLFAAQSCFSGDDVREKIMFDFGWKFFKGDRQQAQQPNFDDSSWRDVDLPHDWSIEGPADRKWASGTGFLPGGVGWYRKSFILDAGSKNKKLFVLFDGVYAGSEVWLNGHWLGKYPNGYCSFYYDITDKLNYDDKPNTIAVRVDHTDFADSRWYTGSGIYRHVWLVSTEKVHIPIWGTFITTPGITDKNAAVNIKTEITNDTDAPQTVELLTEIKDAGNITVAEVRSKHKLRPKEHCQFTQTCDISNPKRWSVESPYLYTAVTSVLTGSGVCDRIQTRFGVRTFRFDANKGFFLNGKNMKIKGLCLHHDAGCLGAAVPDRALERRLEICKELGANAIRTSHNPPAPELLDLCDRMGLLVIDEAFDEWELAKNKWVKGRNKGKPALHGYSSHFEKWAVKDLQAMIKRDRNHPSIILWSIGNEIDFPNDPYSHPADDNYDPRRPSAKQLAVTAKKLINAAKQMDTTRPVTAALANINASNDTGLAEMLDVVGYNYQEKHYKRDHEKYPDRIIMGSENGDYYNAWKAVTDNSFISSQFLWTGFDYLGEAGPWPTRTYNFGIIDFTGELKPVGRWRQSLWAEQPVCHIVSQPRSKRNDPDRNVFKAVSHWTWPGREKQMMVVTCFSNCESVEMFLNEKSLGQKTLQQAPHIDYRWLIPYRPGVLKAVCKNDGKVVCTKTLGTAAKPEKIVLLPDRKTIAADSRDLCHVMVHITDRDGTIIPSADNLITFTIEGSGRLIGLDNGDTNSIESCKSDKRKAYEGKCLAIIQSTNTQADITLTAASPQLTPAKIIIKSKL